MLLQSLGYRVAETVNSEISPVDDAEPAVVKGLA
jgi:hypothetical protein